MYQFEFVFEEKLKVWSEPKQMVFKVCRTFVIHIKYENVLFLNNFYYVPRPWDEKQDRLERFDWNEFINL